MHDFIIGGREDLIFYFSIQTFEMDLKNQLKFQRKSGPPVSVFPQSTCTRSMPNVGRH
jgi:hypothetical protein